MQNILRKIIENKTRNGRTSSEIIVMPIMMRNNITLDDVNDVIETFSPKKVEIINKKPIKTTKIKRGKQNNKEKVLKIRINLKLHDNLKELAKREVRTMSFIVRKQLNKLFPIQNVEKGT